MDKFIKSFILCVFALISIPGYSADFEVDGICYNIISNDKKTCEVTNKGGNYSGNIEIPSVVMYRKTVYEVTAIGEDAFCDETIESIIIPSSVTRIGNNAFWYCSSLTSITIPSSVTNIGEWAFAGCSGLTSIIIPSSVTSIGEKTFSGCSGLTSITIPSSVTGIGNGAFEGCSSLTSITIPSSVTNIGELAFAGCSSLTSITIPSSVTSIGNRAFEECNLISIIVSPDNKVYDSRDKCNAIINTSSNELIVGCKNTVIPSSVTSIGENSFNRCSGLTSITIPSSVTNIGEWAFAGCSGLTSITIPSSVTSIGNDAFWYCSSLTSITIPSSVTGIGDYAFSGCSSLTSITIPSSVTGIGDYAFSGCSSLTSITIPSSVTSIGKGVFGRCNLESIIVSPDNSVFDSRVNCNAIINSSSNELIAGCKNTVIPSSVTSIGKSAFFGCYGLTSITIPSSVTGIGDYAFSGCSSLTSITIPSSVTSIGVWGLYCVGLKWICAKMTTPPELTSNVFYGIDKETCQLIVPKSCVSAYKNTSGWKEFKNILSDYAADDISQFDYAVYSPDVKGITGKTIDVPIYLKNVNEIATWQADLTLPEGITIATDSYGDPLIAVSGSRTSSSRHSVATATLADGSTRILFSSSANKTITGTDGEVATITLNIANDVEPDDYSIIFKNQVMSETTQVGHKVEQFVSKINIRSYTPGDVNNDGEINAQDLVGVVNYILETPVTGSIREAADLNNDGNVDAMDYVAEVSLILSDGSASAKCMAKAKKVAACTGALDVPSFNVNAGEDKVVAVSLVDANTSYTCVQFDVDLPDGVSIVDAESTMRSHSVAYSTLSNGMTRVLISSATNKAMTRNDILNLTIKADSNVKNGDYNMGIDNAILVAPDTSASKPANAQFPFTVGTATGIDDVDVNTNDSSTRFNVAGQRVGTSAKGMIIVNGKKQFVK